MGVLMSKKQQVEKVQKCTAVVSAFQAGIKDRPATTKPAEEVEEVDGPAKTSAAPEEKNTEEVGKEETDNSAGPSTSQQASAPSRDECKVNQEAWSRLRDGKGVEPEDLDKTHQLTPPAFVRPKREADDDQPLEVELDKKEQVLHDNHCIILSLDHKYIQTHVSFTTHSKNPKVISARCQRITMATPVCYVFSSPKLHMIKQFSQVITELLSFI